MPRLALAAGIAGLGVLSVMSGDFAFQWQPVAKSLANHAQWATTIGWLEIAIGVALVVPFAQIQVAGAMTASALFAYWALLHAPDALHNPLNIGAWNGVAEPFAITASTLLLAISRATGETPGVPGDICARAFGLACVVFGAAHFVYAEFTASMVPHWLPLPLVLAYVTGSIHAGTGLALLFGFQRFLASLAEAAMMTSFVLLVHLPRIFAAPSNRFEWTMGFVAVVLSSSAWGLARHFRPRQSG